MMRVFLYLYIMYLVVAIGLTVKIIYVCMYCMDGRMDGYACKNIFYIAVSCSRAHRHGRRGRRWSQCPKQLSTVQAMPFQPHTKKHQV